MARAVDADDVIRTAKGISMTELFPNWKELSSETRNAIGVYGQFWKTLLEDIPTIEAEPVKHGKWEEMRNAYGELEGWIHAECGREVKCMENFCPNCGARMDGE